MRNRTFIASLGSLIVAAALASCGKKIDEAAASADERQAEAQVADQAVAEAAPAEVAEITKVSSQGAAAGQATGVFAQAAEGDPEAVFLARCQYCHVQLGPGTITLGRRLGDENALLANRTDLTKDYVKAVVRNGLNTMPAISRIEVSDEELALIAEYLTRNNEAADE